LEGHCALCGRTSRLIAAQLGVCGECLRTRPEEALAIAARAHAEGRRLFGLPEEPPRTAGGVRCGLCAHDCVIGEGGRGYCGLRTVQDGRLVHLAGTPKRGVLHWYRDPLPTNCVADWVCAGHEKYGYHNLAVFYCSCTFDCLFCQNYHYREVDPVRSEGMSAGELADAANERTFCVCYFGGDPASQMTHALASARLLAERGVRVCWETNGSVVASTLLVPGYVDAEEVGRIARFIADLDPTIPYALLAFAPHFLMPDLPRTSVRHAEEAEAAARAAGLTNVRVGNRHLLSQEY